MFRGQSGRRITQRIAPPGGQQQYQKADADGHVTELQPAPGAVVRAGFGSIRQRVGFGGQSHCFSALNLSTTYMAGLEKLFFSTGVAPEGSQRSFPGVMVVKVGLPFNSCESSSSETATSRASDS